MSDKDRTTLPRRQFVKMSGAGVALVPFLPLAGCGGDSGGSDASSAADEARDTATTTVDAAKDLAKDTADAAEQMAGDVADTVDEAADTVGDAASDAMDKAEQMADDAAADVSDKVNEAMSGGDMPRLSEDDAQAKALNYKHDATTVTAARYEAGQKCSNCLLYTGGDKEWGPCSIFAGKLVNANGWCSTYAPKAG